MKFSTQMHQIGNNTGIPVPPEVVEALGGGKQPLVTVKVNGYEYRSSIASMRGMHMISFSSDKRAATGIGGGDPIDVELELDTAPRTVDLPEDLAAAIDAADLRDAWNAVSPSQQKAHVTNVEGAKAAETRERRVAAIITKLTEG
jgi:hypothetical protein